jgi:hypothetical protein
VYRYTSEFELGKVYGAKHARIVLLDASG